MYEVARALVEVYWVEGISWRIASRSETGAWRIRPFIFGLVASSSCLSALLPVVVEGEAEGGLVLVVVAVEQT